MASFSYDGDAVSEGDPKGSRSQSMMQVDGGAELFAVVDFVQSPGRVLIQCIIQVFNPQYSLYSL